MQFHRCDCSYVGASGVDLHTAAEPHRLRDEC